MSRAAPRPPRPSLFNRLSHLRRLIARRRRLVSAVLVGVAVALSVGAVAPPDPPTSVALIAVRNLAPGHLVTGDDVREVQMPVELVPASSVAQPAEAVGRIVSVPLAEGELLTTSRLAVAGALRGYPADTVAVPVRIPDAGSVRLLRPGGVVDVLASQSDASLADSAGNALAAEVVAAGIRVLAVPATGDDTMSAVDAGGEGGLVVLAASPEQAARLAQAQVLRRISVVMRRE